MTNKKDKTSKFFGTKIQILIDHLEKAKGRVLAKNAMLSMLKYTLSNIKRDDLYFDVDLRYIETYSDSFLLKLGFFETSDENVLCLLSTLEIEYKSDGSIYFTLVRNKTNIWGYSMTEFDAETYCHLDLFRRCEFLTKRELDLPEIAKCKKCGSVKLEYSLCEPDCCDMIVEAHCAGCGQGISYLSNSKAEVIEAWNSRQGSKIGDFYD